MFCRVLP